MPKNAMIHIQKIAPGPPMRIAPQAPTMLPVPTREAVETIKAKCKKNPTVQIYVADGLSSAAVAANIGDLLPAILQGLESYKIDVGTPFFVKYGRVGVMDEISELTGATVTCTG